MVPEIDMEVDEPVNPPQISDEFHDPKIEDFPDSDDEDSSISPTVDEPVVKLSLSESLSRANGFKDAGNSSFKRDEYAEAGKRYQEGIVILNDYQKNKENLADDDVKTLLVSLHGNNAMVLMKLENWNAAIVSATEVLKVEKNNIKSLFRRGVSYHKVGFLEESKTDLIYLLELDSKNSAASKELIQVMKDIKENKQKEKVVFSNMFKKNIYGDKEAERIAKEKKEELEKEKENDEWISSKLSRREKGLDEQTFDDWKKEKKEIQEKKKKDQKELSEKADKEKDERIESERKEKMNSEKRGDDENDVKGNEEESDYDEEDSKILSETKKKGYCYFRNEQSSEVKALIGDITPKAITIQNTTTSSNLSVQPDDTILAEEGETEGMKISSWNHAGTWEEKDMTEFSKNRITALCLNLETNNTESSSGSSVRVYVTGVKSVEGEAQIVMARGKKRFIYDFNVTLDIEIVLDTVVIETDKNAENGEMKEVPKTKSKKYKGTLHLPEVSPSINIESNIQLKKTIPSSMAQFVQTVTDSLQTLTCEKMKNFETEFKLL